MQARPNSYRLFQVTGVITSLVAVALMVWFKGLNTHMGVFWTVEGLILSAAAAGFMAGRARHRR